MSKYVFTDNFLTTLSDDQKRRIEEKIGLIGLPNTTMEERLDNWIGNFRDQSEKEIALNIFFEIDYFNEERIEKLLKIYKTKLSQYLADKGKNIKDVIVVTPEGKADSADSHAYKLCKEWNLPTEIFLSANDISQENSSGKILLFFNDTHGSGRQFIREFSDVINHAGSSNCFIFCYTITEKAISLFRRVFSGITIVPEIPTPTIHDKTIFTEQQLQLIQSLGLKVYPPHPMGYGNCGLLAAYHFQCPNNNLPIVWANGPNNSYINDNGENVDGYPWIPLFQYKPKTKFRNDISHNTKISNSNFIAATEQEFFQCRKDKVGLSRKRALARILEKINLISSNDFDLLVLKVRVLAQSSNEARSCKEFHKINLEIDLIYEKIFKINMINSQTNIAVTNFVNWAIDYSQLAENSVEFIFIRLGNCMESPIGRMLIK